MRLCTCTHACVKLSAMSLDDSSEVCCVASRGSEVCCVAPCGSEVCCVASRGSDVGCVASRGYVPIFAQCNCTYMHYTQIHAYIHTYTGAQAHCSLWRGYSPIFAQRNCTYMHIYTRIQVLGRIVVDHVVTYQYLYTSNIHTNIHTYIHTYIYRCSRHAYMSA